MISEKLFFTMIDVGLHGIIYFTFLCLFYVIVISGIQENISINGMIQLFQQLITPEISIKVDAATKQSIMNNFQTLSEESQLNNKLIKQQILIVAGLLIVSLATILTILFFLSKVHINWYNIIFYTLLGFTFVGAFELSFLFFVALKGVQVSPLDMINALQSDITYLSA